MQKMMMFFLCISIGTAGFTEHITINNQYKNPVNHQQANVVIQWAISAKDVEKNNKRIKQGGTLNPDALQSITHQGMINIDIPKKATYFRLMVWPRGVKNPDSLTNWVDIVPNKIYTLTKEYLVPLVLMSGTGC